MNLEDYIPAEPDIDDDTLAFLRGRLLRSATAAPGRAAHGRVPSQATPRSRRVRRSVLTSLSAMGLAVVLFVLAAAFTSGRTPPADASPLAQAIDSLAGTTTAPSTSGSLGVAHLPPGDYVYRLVETADEVIKDRPGRTALRYLEPQTLQFWQLSDGSGLERIHALPPVFSTTQDRQDAGLPPPPADRDVTLPPSSSIEPASYRYLSSLPLDTVALKARLVDDSRGGLDPQRTFQLAVDLLDAGPPPAVQATLYRLAGSIAGVRPAHGQVTDALGRLAEAVQLQDDGNTEQLLFDEHSGAYLGTEVLEPTGQVNSYRLIRTVSVATTLAVPTPAPASGRPGVVGASSPAGRAG